MSRRPGRPGRDTAHADAREPGPDISRGGRGSSSVGERPTPDRDPSEPLARQIAIPRYDQRRPVLFREQTYDLRASDIRALATIGAFRVIPADALPIPTARDPWHGDLDHLRRAKLVAIHSHVIEGERVALVTLSHRGRAFLQHHQSTPEDERRQAYYAGFVKPRELAHDAQLYDMYKEHAGRVEASGGRVQRVVLDYELKRQYQQFLQANNRRIRPQRTSAEIQRWANQHGLVTEHGRVKFPPPSADRDPDGDRARELQHQYQQFVRGEQPPSDGRPDRTPEEIHAWATRHNLSVVDGSVKFPDVRIEYVDADGRRATRDVELATGHYTDRQVAAKTAAGFHVHHAGGRLGGGRLVGARTKHGATPRSSQGRRLS